jgi:GAF domain-containing protein
VGETKLKAESIAKTLHGAFCRDVPRQGLLQIAAEKIRQTGAPYTSVYMYMVDDSGDMLQLEAFDGRPTDLTKIPVGQGVCGKAVAEKIDLNVPDVCAAEEYLECSVDTRSELVVLIRRHEEILGQIDIDSDVLNGFDEPEVGAVREVADALAALL